MNSKNNDLISYPTHPLIEFAGYKCKGKRRSSSSMSLDKQLYRRRSDFEQLVKDLYSGFLIKRYERKTLYAFESPN